MYVLRLICTADQADELVGELWRRGTRGIIEDELPGDRRQLRAYFDEPFPIDELAPFSPRWEYEQPRNWAREIMDSWSPIVVGERFFIAPEWRSDPTPPGRLRLVVYPGAALGTGYHPTTQLCLEAMEKLARPEDIFVDVGTGSGILCQAAWLLGIRKLIGCDTDPEAIRIARENLFARQRVPALLFTGSVEALRSGLATLVAANIGRAPLVERAAELSRILRPGGYCLATGFDSEEAPLLKVPFEEAGFSLVEESERAEWAFQLWQRRPR